MHTVKITSAFTNESWEGKLDIQVQFTDPNATPIEKYGTGLSILFRFFNRVDDEDNERLESIGYTLPSMSVGDLVEIDGERFHVLPQGFRPTNSLDPLDPMEAYQ